MVYIETPRLILRDWKEEDIQLFAGMNNNPDVMRYFLNPLSEEESFNFYTRIRKEFSDYGYGLYALEEKETGTFIGYTGFHHIPFEVDSAPGIEIGWRINNAYWNRGYATEAALACLQYAKERLPFKTVWSFTSLPNKSSERVMQKIGMERVKTFFHPSLPDGHPLKEHVLYKISL